ncbi:MAG: rhombosortase [Steroidobacteraceae bacterium]|nr:rhombosortase [Steroidobacteraceae bacterium]
MSLRPDGARGAGALALVLLLLGLALGGEPLRRTLRWDRAALEAGEAWRLVTGHLVHLDLAHAVLNVAGMLLVWALFARLFTALQWGLVVLAGVAAIDLGLWLVNVELRWYVGASGVLHAAMAAGIVRRMIERDVIAWGLGVVGVAKLVYEHVSGAMPFTSSGALVVTDAHLYGALAGMVCGLLLGRDGPGGR